LVSSVFGRVCSAARIASRPCTSWSGVIGRAIEPFSAKQSAAASMSPRSSARL